MVLTPESPGTPVTTTSTYNNRDQLLTDVTGSATITNTYDSNGSLITKTDAAGTTTYGWDVRGRLVSLAAPGGVTASYDYTPEGVRSAVTENGTTTRYLIDAQSPSGYAQVIEERTTSGLLLAQYIYGVGLNASAVYRPDQGGAIYLSDGHSGIRQILDGAGTIVRNYRYDAFGQQLRNDGTFTSPNTYRGERFDATLGQYYLRARYYDPRQGRFTGMDPFGGNYNDPLQAMRYGYAGLNPVGGMDPSGMWAAFGLAVGSIGGLSARGAHAPATTATGAVAASKITLLSVVAYISLAAAFDTLLNQVASELIQKALNTPKDPCAALGLAPGINAKWNLQRPPVSGNTTVLAAAYRIDSTPLRPGEYSDASSRAWARSVGTASDDAGHVIARVFGGKNVYNGTEGNIFPQNPYSNRVLQWGMESRLWANYKLGGEGCAIVVPEYSGPLSTRPDGLIFLGFNRPPLLPNFVPLFALIPNF